MRAYRRFSGVWQMAVSVAVFAALLLLLDSGGLLDWAERLDLGLERSVALPLTMALHDRVARLGIERARRGALVELVRAGWSDDPAALAQVRPSPSGRWVLGVQEHAAERPPLVMAAPVNQPAMLWVAPSTAKPAAIPAVANGSAATLPPAPKPMAGAPPLVSHLPELAAVPPGTTRTVALAGDSMMAVGLSATILRQAPQYKDLVLVKAFKSGTGLARPEVFDWKTEYPAMLNGARPDVVIVAIGANDGQGFVDGGVTYAFGTPQWQAIYRARVTAYLQLLEAGGATVVWLGLPPMKSDVYDARTALVNRIDYAVVSASPHAVWFSTAGLFGDAAGRFQDFGSVHGVPARLRQEDGIHISDAGAVLVADRLLPWLDSRE
jgi:hypothetical protein